MTLFELIDLMDVRIIITRHPVDGTFLAELDEVRVMENPPFHVFGEGATIHEALEACAACIQGKKISYRGFKTVCSDKITVPSTDVA